MTPECLVKLKPVVSEQVYEQLQEAAKNGDNKTWDLTMEAYHSDIRLLKRQAIIDANLKTDLVIYVKSQERLGVPPSRALLDIVSGSGSRQSSSRVSLDRIIEARRGLYMSSLTEAIHATRPKFLGLSRSRDSEYAENLVKYIFGDADATGGGKGIDKMADAWKNTTRHIMNDFNKAGGAITELEQFNIPVTHYSPSIIKAGEDTWVKDAKNLFDLRKLPGRENISDDELLRKIYRNITTEGKSILNPDELGKRGNKKLGNIHQQFRWLQPKNGSSWLEYTKKYGRHNSPIDAMIEYIDSMSTQIGLVETLGSNPTKNFNDIIENLRERTGDNLAGAQAKASLDQIISRNPAYESKVTEALRGLRNFQTVTKLGMAPITALSDVFYSSLTSLYNGMPAMKVFSRHIKNLNPFLSSDRKLAGKLGLIMEYALSRAASVNRYSDINAYGYLHRAADFSTRASGLNHWTTTAKTAFGLEFLSNMADHAVKDFDSLPKGLNRALSRYGFNTEDWSLIRKAIIDEQGTKFIDVNKIEDDSLAARIIGMIREETSYAVPEPNARSKAIASLGIPTNTVANEIAKVATQFKSFGVSIILSHWGRALDKSVPVPVRMGYSMSLLLGSSLMGMGIVQLKDIAKGKNPRELSPELVLEGFLQGGSTGVLGDVVFNDPDMFGGFPAFIAGPTASDVQDVMKFMHGTPEQVKEASKNWEKAAKRAGGQAVSSALELPSKMWYLRVAMERLMIDAVNRETDPKFNQKIRNTRKWMKEERKQTYWWTPGQSRPDLSK